MPREDEFGINERRLADEIQSARDNACAYDGIDPRADKPAFSGSNPWASYYWTLERFRLMKR